MLSRSVKVYSVALLVFSFLLTTSAYPSLSPETENDTASISLSEPSSSTINSTTVTDLGINETTTAESVAFDTLDGTQCVEGILLGVWLPQDNLSTSDRVGRGMVYFLALCYLFVGVAIVSDRFMASIEVITSNEKNVKVRKPNGDIQVVKVRVWNETVANLTLMALGSSSPEILLSIIEIFGKNFVAGELGPGTIVGSAAFNLFIIMDVCVSIIPKGENRKIKHLRVFLVTATWSVFAYIWLYLILCYFSPGRVEVWEAFLTFLFFPGTVITAYIAERRLLFYKYLSKEYRVNKRGILVQREEAVPLKMNGHDRLGSIVTNADLYEEERHIEDARKEYMTMLQTVRKEFPRSDLEHLEIIAQERLMSGGRKSHAFYRIQATRKLMGSGDIMRKIAEQAENDFAEVKAELQQIKEEEDKSCRVFFEPGHYAIMENCENFQIRVVRRGNLSNTTTVNYETEDGSAEAGHDYVKTQGTLVFSPGVTEQRFTLQVLDNDLYNNDKHFYVRLSNVSEPAVLASPKVVTVMIIDDDHGGVVEFEAVEHELVESTGVYDVKVQRNFGARGKIVVPFWTEDGTAKAGKHYESLKGQLEFDDNEIEKVIRLVVIDEGSYEKDVSLHVHLGEPKPITDEIVNDTKETDALTKYDELAVLGRPKLGEITKTCLKIKESKEFKSTIDKLVQRANQNILIGTSSWKQQFADAWNVSSDDSNGDDATPSRIDYIMHWISVFWKLLFAFIPPTEFFGGYICFVVSIVCIGYLTAIIGDVASHFGCTLGIKDSVTAILFVAAGTSLPDTFASKIAAVNDKTADNSIGNVTGSNAVNVYLGIGIAWTLAAIYHAYHGTVFAVEPGSLAFSLSLFLGAAIVAITILLARRSDKIGGEFGGQVGIKYLTSAVLFGLWFMYVTVSTLEAYGFFEGF